MLNDSQIKNRWRNMFARCENLKALKDCPSYVGCSVCAEWRDFNSFKDWWTANDPGIPVALDKDLLVKGNKTYAPEFCTLVPPEVNGFLVLRQRRRGEFPIGVTKYRGRYAAQCCSQGKQEWLGAYTTVDEAFSAYKRTKEAEARRLASKYKLWLSAAAYDALVRYEACKED